MSLDNLTLRPYQQQTLDALLRDTAGGDSALAILPTGCGKTVIFCVLIDKLLENNPGKFAVILAHRGELVYQAVDKAEKITGRHCAIEMGDLRADCHHQFVRPEIIASTFQTQYSGRPGLERMTKLNPEEVAVVIVDEAHHAVSKSYKNVVEYFRKSPTCRIVGVTATPDRGDQEALGQIFDKVSFQYNIVDAISDGWLTPIRQVMVQINGLDLSEVRTTAGDLNGGDLAKILEREHIVQGFASAIVQQVGEKRTLIFCESLEQVRMMCEVLNRHKPNSAHEVNGTTDKKERKGMVSRYALGEFQFMVNCGVFTEGFDDAGVEVVVLARPTKSRALYCQMLGRGTRPSDDIAGTLAHLTTPEGRQECIQNSKKPECTVIDFVGNCGRHKLITAVDILGGNITPELAEEAKKIIERGGAMLAADAILQAKEAAEVRRLAEEARRAHIVGKAQFTAVEVSPFELYRIRTRKPRSKLDSVRRLSEKQLSIFENLGIVGGEKLTTFQKRQILDEHFQRISNGRPSFKQENLLRKLGYELPVLTKDGAKKIIDGLIVTKGWRK